MTKNMTFFRSCATALIFLLNAGPAAAQQDALPKAIAPLRVAGAAINVVDIERSLAFYTEILELKVALRVPGSGPVFEYLLSSDGTINNGVVILTKASGEQPLLTGFGRLVLVVPDADALVEKSRVAGYPPLDEGRFAHFIRDPDGTLVELFEFPSPSQ